MDFTLQQLEDAAALVHEVVPPTPAYAWPLLCRRVGVEVWAKHENHTPIGAFKVRGGVIHLGELKAANPDLPGVISATRGNHGQSVAHAATRLGVRSVIVVPHGNSVEKNAAMRAWGAELVEQGDDFQAAREWAEAAAEREGLVMIPSFAETLVRGVASYPLELFRAAPDLDTVYVPIGLGSGICATIAARNALNLKTKVVGVVSENAPAYALSFDQGRPVSTNSADTMADGMACRVPEPHAVEIINRHAERVVTVSDAEIEAAIRAFYKDTHNVVEGAGAAPLAALIKEKEAMAGKKTAVMVSGGNIDAPLYRRILGEDEDRPA